VFSALPKGLPRLISVGRLDINTEGLLLLTNDGSLARVLDLPPTGWLRRYRVRAYGRATQEQLERLRPGITIDGIRYGPIEATLERAQGSNVWLIFAMREGKNREVKNVLGHLGLKVNRLIRVSFGPFQLGELAAGEVTEVKTRTLRDQLGERLAAAAGVDFSGALGLEALSRGAVFALFIDDAAEARALVRENVEALGLGGVTRIFRRDAIKIGPAHPLPPFSLALLDPPYGQGLAEQSLAAARA